MKKRTRTARSNNTQFMIRIILIILIVLLSLLCIGLTTLKILGLDDFGKEAPVPVLEHNEDLVLVDDEGNVIDPSSVSRVEKSYNFLLLGQDKKAMLTDVMMLINFDATNHKVTIMQFPRDSYIEVSSKACMSCMTVPNNAQGYSTCSKCNGSMTDVGSGYRQKMNSVYNTYYSALRSADSKASEKELTLFGMEGLASEIERNMNITIDYHVHMDLQGFRDIVDSIGGVDMDVPYRMKYSDPEQNLYIDLQPGYQNLDGDEAEQFVRFRSDYVNGDLGRQDAQKLFMVAFFKKFQSEFSITDAPGLLSTMMKHVTHTVPISDLDFFAVEALSMDFNNITMFSAPNTIHDYPNNGGSYVVLNKKELYEISNKYFNLYANGIKTSFSSFDKNKRFTDEYDSTVNYKYESDMDFEGEKTAQDINDDGVYIPGARK